MARLERECFKQLVWRGNDGSEGVAHVVLLHDYDESVDVRRLREDALHHQQASVHDEFLVPTGYGDGGGGPTEEMCERVRRLRDLAGAPRAEWGGIEAWALLGLRIDGHEVALRGAGHRLVAYPDHPAAFEAWDVDRNTLVNGVPAICVGGPEISLTAGEASLSFAYRAAVSSTVRVTYRVTADEPVLRIDYEIDWRDPEWLLKAVFSTAYQGRQARFGTPFGSTLRGQWPGQTREEALWEVPFSRWLIVMDDAQAEGLAVVTCDRYGATVREGEAGVTLLRSARVTEADHHPAIRETPARPDHSDLGGQRVSLAIARFAGNLPQAEHPAMLADTLFTPCVAVRGMMPCAAGLAAMEHADTLIPAWSEPVAVGLWCLRVHEVGGRHGRAKLTLLPGWQAVASSLSATTPPTAGWQTGTLEMNYTAYAVATVWFLATGVERLASVGS